MAGGRCREALQRAGPNGPSAQEGLQVLPGRSLGPGLLAGSRLLALEPLQDVILEESPLLQQFVLQAEDAGSLLAIGVPAQLAEDVLELPMGPAAAPGSSHHLLGQLLLQVPCLTDGVATLLLQHPLHLAQLSLL